MRFRDLVVTFDEALELAIDDALLADHLPSRLPDDDAGPEGCSVVEAEVA